MMTLAPAETGRAAAQWMAEAARFLREEGRPASTAEVIDGVRLAGMLAQFRNQETPGEEELLEAARCVLCGGEQALAARLADFMRPVTPADELPEAERAGLLEDFLRTCKRLRLNLRAEASPLALDLRRSRDLAKSQFLHRLMLLKLDGVMLEGPSGRARGTFRESWMVAWTEGARQRLEYLSRRSRTIVDATASSLSRRAGRANSLPALAALAESAFLAGMAKSLEELLGKIEYSAALAAEFPPLAATLGPLAKIACFGTIRPAEADAARRSALALAPRATEVFPGACRDLDDGAAVVIQGLLLRVQASISLLHDGEVNDRWRRALASSAESAHSHQLVAGTATRVLLAVGAWSPGRVCQTLEREMSAGAAPGGAARWLEGFFGHDRGSTIQHPEVVRLVNSWLLALSPEVFLHCLPLLRRTFARMSEEDRRRLQQQIANPGPLPSPPSAEAPAPPMTMTLRLLKRPGRKEAP